MHFLWSYYQNCYRKGYRIDLWHFNLLMNLFVIHIMLPFDRSDLNIFALGPILLRRAQNNMTEAYLVSAFGYFCLLVGGSLWRIRLNLGIRRQAASLFEIPARLSLVLLQSRLLLLVQSAVAVALIGMVLAYYFKTAGFGFNLRSLELVDPVLRASANFVSFFSVLIGSFCAARYFRLRETSILAALLCISVGLVFFGSRYLIAELFMSAFLVYLVELRQKLRLIWLFATMFLALAASVLLDALRSHNFSASRIASTSGISILYGNSFSDTRDFALILSSWDRHYFLGKTYLAGLFAFVPRFLSPFRDKWALGVVTATMAGFSPREHPGLRVGSFGEAYLNFGLLGVLLVGLFVGALLRLIDIRVKQSLDQLPSSGVRVYSYLNIGLLTSVALNSTGAATSYTILLTFLTSWLLVRFSRFINIPLG